MKIFLYSVMLTSLLLTPSCPSPLDQHQPRANGLRLDDRAQFEERISKLENLVDSLVKKLDESKSNQRVNNADWDRVTVSTNPKAMGATSCLDLWRMNQTAAGYYLVRSSDGKKLKSVYCDAAADFTENVIGYLDVKTDPVFFAAFRPGEYKNDNNAVILNYPIAIAYHDAFNNFAGGFKAPVSGIYKFDFFAHAYGHADAGDRTSDGTVIALLKNGIETDIQNFAQSDRPAESPLSFTVVSHLLKNDYIETRFKFGNIRDCHFSGVLLEADLE